MIDVPVLVKDALRDGRMKKNFRILVLNDDGTTDFVIDNNTLVKESVNIDERMCSGDTLKFGLCEGSSLEFQYFGKPNITGKRVQVFVDVQYRENPYETVGELNSSGAHYRYDVAEAGDYRIYINADQVSNVATSSSVSVSHNGPTTYYDMVVKPDGHGEVLLPGLTTIDMIYLWAKPWKYAESTVQIDRGSYYSIPMGFFDVKKCSRQASTGIIKATCYNKLQSDYLDAKANDLLINAYDELVALPGVQTVTIDAVLHKALENYEIVESGYEQTHFIEGTFSSAYQTGYMEYRIYSAPGVPTNEYVRFLLPKVKIGIAEEDIQYISSSDYWMAEGYWRIYVDTSPYYEALSDYVDTVIEQLNLQDCLFYDDGEYVGLKEHLFNRITSSQSNHRSRICAFKYRNDYFTRLLIDGVIESNIIQNISGYQGTKEFIQFENIPCVFTRTDNPLSPSDAEKRLAVTESIELIKHANFILYKQLESEIGSGVISKNELEQWQNITLRDLQTATFETLCQFGQLSRETDLFSGVELNHERLYPADTLYPADDLYPGGGALSGFKSLYSKLWADEGNVRKWRYLIITYKGLDGNNNEADFTLQRTVNADGTDDYNMSDNWLFRNLIWTAAQVGEYADAMVTKMQYLRWFPFEMWAAGLPYLETGDEIEIPLNGVTYTSYILRRQLKGIQNLQDTYINGVIDIY